MSTARFKVRLERHAEKDFGSLPPSVRQRFYEAFEALEKDPFRSRPLCDIRMLKGHPDVRALRVGNYRGIYEVSGSEVRFTTFGHRRNVYKG